MRHVKTAKEFKIDRLQRQLSCDRCPPHRGENNERVPRRSWKLKTKKRKQFAVR